MNPEWLILACRNENRGKDALLRGQSWIIDRANFGSATAFADKCTGKLDRHDILVENAWMSPFVPKMIGTARRFGVYPRTRTVVVASDKWLKRPNILAKLSSKEYSTPMLNVLSARAFQQRLPWPLQWRKGAASLCLVLSEEQTRKTSFEGRTYYSRKSLKKATL
ncbi:hypothetical protein IW261DRAFT_1597707 [Armillaria novae-zelandiae]|uniref:Uncharacterized protein n=1 Tax=Armillaria novae-zelandiae TaxID=153914 RepID=A0AA39TZB8_9AGAR|nr:hypothetical protein IW261DRAFT_1597707 [Armillaria novae-zelandiae]